MAWDLANYFVANDTSVTVLCPQPSRPLNSDYSSYTNPHAIAVTREAGVEVVRLPSYSAPQSKLFDRLHESYSFGRQVCRYLSRQRSRPDVIYVNSWPMLAQALIARYAQSKRIPMVLQIMDIYPESLLNKMSNLLRGFLAPPLTMFDRWIARQAARVLVISENMRRTYIENRKIETTKVAVIDLWQDDSMFESLPARQDACLRYKIPDGRFTFLYLGNIGPVAGVDFLIRAFHEAAIDASQLVIVGDGSEKAVCAELVGQLSASNIYFISDSDVTNVPLLQSLAHICLLPLKVGAGMSSIPSKLPAYMFSAKPVLATVDEQSDTAHVIRQAGCGWVGKPEDMKWLVEKMRETASSGVEDLQMYGQNGRDYGLAHFSKTQGVRRLAQMVLSAIPDFTQKSRAGRSI